MHVTSPPTLSQLLTALDVGRKVSLKQPSAEMVNEKKNLIANELKIMCKQNNTRHYYTKILQGFKGDISKYLPREGNRKTLECYAARC